jgi:hypothetical protein
MIGRERAHARSCSWRVNAFPIGWNTPKGPNREVIVMVINLFFLSTRQSLGATYSLILTASSNNQRKKIGHGWYHNDTQPYWTDRSTRPLFATSSGFLNYEIHNFLTNSGVCSSASCWLVESNWSYITKCSSVWVLCPILSMRLPLFCGTVSMCLM